MQIFLDSANISEIRAAKAMGVLDGVTTNPSLIAKAKLQSKRRFEDIIKEICLECGGLTGEEQMPPEGPQLPVSVEVLAIDYQGMVDEGRRLARIATNVVVKLPCTEEGLRACHVLSTENISTNLTLCFSAMQALLVAKAGATYVSPFVGRLDDVGENGLDLLANIKMIYNNYGYPTKILAASMRNVLHIFNAARIGVDVVTVPFSVIKKLMAHPLTAEGLEIFLKDAREATQRQD